MWRGFGAATVPSKRRDRPLLRVHASVKISEMPVRRTSCIGVQLTFYLAIQPTFSSGTDTANQT